jgi:hypothetical protein
LYVNEYFEVTMENDAKVDQDLTIEPVVLCKNRYYFFMPLMLNQSEALEMSNGNFGMATLIPQGLQPDNANVTWRVYYPGRALRVQTTSGDALSYLVQDHLNSTSLTLNISGSIIGEMVYSASSFALWARSASQGETRYSFGATPIDRLYTGQYEAEVGLYFYNARWYNHNSNWVYCASPVFETWLDTFYPPLVTCCLITRRLPPLLIHFSLQKMLCLFFITGIIMLETLHN